LAVAKAEQLGSSEAAGKELGIEPRYIRRWRDDPQLSEIVRKTREETAEDVTAAMVLSWARLIERLERDDIDTRDLIILAGVATDKAQLLSGNATERTETRDLTDGLPIDLKRRLRERLARSVRGESEPIGEGSGALTGGAGLGGDSP
jgi:hypothetical protein